MITSNDKRKSFCQKYYVRVLNDTKRFVRSTPIPTISFDESYKTHFEIESEPLLIIEIPQSKLDTLVDLESTFYNNIDNVHQRRMYEAWLDEQQEQRFIRENHAAVKLAYEQYQLLLNLSRIKPKQIKD